jgi:hypothetical protein
VDEHQPPKAGGPRAGRAAGVVGIALGVVALGIALFVVVRSLRKVEPEPLPPALKTTPPDTGLVVFRANMRRRVRNLAARCESRRREFGEVMTPAQDSMSRECDSGLALVRGRIAALDTVSRENRKTAVDSVRAAYERAKLEVRAFTRSGRPSDLIDEDSLNQEIKRLVSE